MEVRLQKLIASTGLSSRRKAETLIATGRVTVNGKVVTELGTKVDSERDHVKVDGKHLTAAQPFVYLMLNKPKNVMSTLDDPGGRTTVKDFLRGVSVRVFPVGRLDFNTEGLIIMTNDGEFTNAVAGSKKIPKVYVVKVKGLPTEVAIRKLARGVRLEDGFKTAPAEIKTLKPTDKNGWYEVTLYEGHNQQIRKMFDSVGHSVVKLRRIRIGNIDDLGLPVGRHRKLTEKEVRSLLAPRKPTRSS